MVSNANCLRDFFFLKMEHSFPLCIKNFWLTVLTPKLNSWTLTEKKTNDTFRMIIIVGARARARRRSGWRRESFSRTGARVGPNCDFWNKSGNLSEVFIRRRQKTRWHCKWHILLIFFYGSFYISTSGAQTSGFPKMFYCFGLIKFKICAQNYMKSLTS